MDRAEPGNHISHNLISDFDYSGISVGWTWGYGPSIAGANIIEDNEVRNLGIRSGNAEPPLGDMGGIYTLGKQPGTTIRRNYVHDVAGRTKAWGIYFDEGSSGILAEENIISNTSHGGFHQHYGADNVVRDNLFIQNRTAQIWRTVREDHNSFTFEGNVVVGATDLWLSGDWSGGFSSGHNLYWRTDGKVIVFPGKLSLAQWQAKGFDQGSIEEDPDLQIALATHPVFGKKSSNLDAAFTLPDLRNVGPQP